MPFRSRNPGSPAEDAGRSEGPNILQGVTVSGQEFGDSALVYSVPPNANTIGMRPPFPRTGPVPASAQLVPPTAAAAASNAESTTEFTSIPFAMFPSYARKKLELFDTDGNKHLDIDEILDGVDALHREKERSKQLKWAVAGLFLILILLLVAIGVMMFIIVQSAKDTGMDGAALTVKGTNTTIQTASSDFYVEDGMMKNRKDPSGRRCTGRPASDGSCTKETALMTSQASFSSPLSSRMDDQDLIELKQLTVTQGSSWVHFQVLAVARYFNETSRYGSIVVIYTHIGELTLDGEAMFFNERIAGAFSRAGFVVDPNHGRRLLGVVEMLGLFNSLRQAASADPDSALAEAINAIPLRFYAEVTEFKTCNLGPDCFLGNGKMVDHAELMTGEDIYAVVSQEQQYFQDSDSGPLARTQVTSPQYPEQTLTKLRNATHLLEFQTFKGGNYFCALSEDDSLEKLSQRRRLKSLEETIAVARRFADVTSRRQASAKNQDNYTEVEGIYIEKDDIEVTKTDHGFRSVRDKNGGHVYCKYITMHMTVKGKTLNYDVWEDYQQKTIFQVGFANVIQRFDVLRPIDDDNKLSESAFDMSRIFSTCDPLNVTAPVEWVEGKKSNIVAVEASWGQVYDPEFDAGATAIPLHRRSAASNSGSGMEMPEDISPELGAHLTSILRRSLRVITRLDDPERQKAQTRDFRTVTRFYSHDEYMKASGLDLLVSDLRQNQSEVALPNGRRHGENCPLECPSDWDYCFTGEMKGQSGAFKYKIMLWLKCLRGSQTIPKLHQMEMTLDLPSSGVCPNTQGNAKVTIDQNYNLYMNGYIEAKFDINYCFVSTLNYAMYQAIDWCAIKMNGKLRVEGQSGYGSFQEKACSRETCSTYSSSSQIGNIHKKNLFFKGYGEIDIRVSNSYFDAKFRARLNGEIVGNLFCTACQYDEKTQNPMYVGINIGAEADIDINFDPYWAPLMSDIKSKTYVEIFPEMWAKSTDCGWVQGGRSERMYQYYRSPSGPTYGFYELPDTKDTCLLP